MNSDAGDTQSSPGETQEMPAVAEQIFGERTEKARRYVEWLSGAGIERGLIGPREAPRLWSRHVLNSAIAASAFADGETVVDVGTGAGLPGIPLALARPDLEITLLEPLLRRIRFLEEVVADLELPVTVYRGRAEEKSTRKAIGRVDVATSRAVAPLAKLARWSAPLLSPGGRLVALKGSSAGEEIERDRNEVGRLGVSGLTVKTVSAQSVDPTYLIVGRTKT